MMRSMIRQFAHKEIQPLIAKMEDEDWFPRPLLSKMAEQGLMGIPIPEEWGGVGADFISYILAIEEISFVSATVGVILAVHTSVGTNPILYFGNDEQKQHYLPKLTSGEYLGAFALTEPQAGSDAARIGTAAMRKGDHYELNGSKVFITNGGEADTYIVFAMTNPERKHHGISAFIVEKEWPGFMIGKQEKKLGLHGSSTTSLIFEGVKVPLENRLGEEGEGFKVAMANLNVGRIGIAAQSLGIAKAAYQAAREYAKERQQFGHSISRLQAIQWKLAEMATRIEAASLLTYRAAQLQQAGRPDIMASSMAKAYASDTAMAVTTEAVQIFGGYGFSKEYPVERFFRDSKVTQIYEGTNQIQRQVIAKQLIID